MQETISRLLKEIRSGNGVGLSQVAREFPGRRGHVDPATVFRWTRSGSRAADGSRVVLESIRVGSKITTSWDAVERFIAALSAKSSEFEPAPRSPAATRRESERAEAELIEARA
jgi:hypothetical protein